MGQSMVSQSNKIKSWINKDEKKLDFFSFKITKVLKRFILPELNP